MYERRTLQSLLYLLCSAGATTNGVGGHVVKATTCGEFLTQYLKTLMVWWCTRVRKHSWLVASTHRHCTKRLIVRLLYLVQRTWQLPHDKRFTSVFHDRTTGTACSHLTGICPHPSRRVIPSARPPTSDTHGCSAGASLRRSNFSRRQDDTHSILNRGCLRGGRRATFLSIWNVR